MWRQLKLARVFGPTSGAFTKIELLVIVCVMAIMAALLLPALSRAKAKRAPINCSARLRQIGLAFRAWASDHSERFPMHVSVTNGGTMEIVDSGTVIPQFQIISNELSTPKILRCPEEGSRGYATNFANLQENNISYFVGLDAIEGRPSSLLSGDRNLTNRVTSGRPLVSLTTNGSLGWTKELHSRKGYLCFADGSVNLFRNGNLDATIQSLGMGTNRLALP
jgi:type II secretory pathway pseudopilin PulG